jgi:peptidoglycan hydrolase-like protein with peptidoglycan-binding domain
MAHVQKQGYRYSENGWPMIDSGTLDFSPIPDLNWKLGVHIGVPNTLLKALIVRLHREVEPCDIRQTGCFTVTNSMRNSNHNSGTAIDYNWNKHQFHAWGTWGANRAKVDKIITDFRGTIEFGGNWTSPRDEMHFELAFGPAHKGALDLANELWLDGLWGIFKPGPRPNPGPIVIPPTQENGYLAIGSSGERVRKLQSGMKVVFRSYAGHLMVDGQFGPITEAAVREFQRRTGVLSVDGVVGPKTESELRKYGVKL